MMMDQSEGEDGGSGGVDADDVADAEQLLRHRTRTCAHASPHRPLVQQQHDGSIFFILNFIFILAVTRHQQR